MSKFLLYTFTIPAIICILTTACNESLQPIDSPNGNTEYSFVCSRINENIDDNETRTYRILAYNTSYYFYYKTTGTYSGIPGGYMCPTVLLDDGTIDFSMTEEEHKSAGFSGLTGSNHIICVSPGIKNNNDGTFDFCPADPETGSLLVTDDVFTELGRIREYNLGSLKDRRSRLTFNFTIDPLFTDIIKSIEISDVELIGAGGGPDENGIYENVSLQPVLRQTICSNNPRHIFVSNSHSSDTITSGPIYVASSFYAPKDTVIKLLSPLASALETDYLQLSFLLSENGGKKTKQTFVINEKLPELKPQYDYTFNFQVQSYYINLFLVVKTYDLATPNDWYKESSSNETIGDNSSTILNLGTWKISGWENGDINLNDNLPIGN